MKKIIYLICVVFIALNAYSQAHTKNSNDSARIEFVDTVLDFGTINEADGKVSHVFEFKNVGGMPLVVLNAKATCGCTVPEWTKTPVEQGKSGTVEVTFNPSKRSGVFEKTITLTTNAKGTYSRLHIKGEINPTVATDVRNLTYKLKRHFGLWDYVLGGIGIVVIVLAVLMFFGKKGKNKIEN